MAANALALPAPLPVAIEPDAASPVNGPAWSAFLELIVTDAGLEHEVAYQLVCIGLIYPVIIAVVARIETPPRLMPLALWLGALSYPIYVLHYPIYRWLERFMPASLTGRLWIAAALIVVLSHVALKWIDVPVRRGLARWSAGH